MSSLNPLPPAPLMRHDAAEATFRSVLRTATEAIDGVVPWCLIGGVATAVYARPRWTHDIDFLVRPHDAKPVLSLLARVGFEVDELDDAWLYKAERDGVVVDVIFKSKGSVYLDRDMRSRLRHRTFQGVPVTVAPPEDLVVIKALVHDEHTPRHWFDALSILATTRLDWPYLVRRAHRSVRRVASLLLYAQSLDIAVPGHVLAALLRLAEVCEE